jgi:cytochrome c553
LVAEGKKIVEEAKCSACHPASFKGAKEVPRLTRQKYPYLVKQLKDYRDGTRTNDDGTMAPAVKGMTDAQIEAVAQYISVSDKVRAVSAQAKPRVLVHLRIPARACPRPIRGRG